MATYIHSIKKLDEDKSFSEYSIVVLYKPGRLGKLFRRTERFIEYRGSMGVWYEYPDARYVHGSDWLQRIWKRHQWELEEKVRAPNVIPIAKARKPK